MDELSFNEESSGLSSDNKKVSSDKEAALLGPLQPVQKQTESLSSDNVLLLIANDFMDVILFDEESSDVSSDNAAAILYLAVFTQPEGLPVLWGTSGPHHCLVRLVLTSHKQLSAHF